MPNSLFSHPSGTPLLIFDVFVAGEAEVDEPFFVEQSCGLFHQLYPPPVVCDQVVVGGEDGGDSSLSRYIK